MTASTSASNQIRYYSINIIKNSNTLLSLSYQNLFKQQHKIK